MLLSLALAWAQSLEETNPKHLVASSGYQMTWGKGGPQRRKHTQINPGHSENLFSDTGLPTENGDATGVGPGE